MTLRYGQRERVGEYTANWLNKPTSVPVEYLVIAGGVVVVVVSLRQSLVVAVVPVATVHQLAVKTLEEAHQPKRQQVLSHLPTQSPLVVVGLLILLVQIVLRLV
jgi:hypothetical protein